MNDSELDVELLRSFVRQDNQSAFACLVRRHLDLVYGTALRKLDNSAAAEEIAQDVFAALARRAWQFAPDDCVPAWLHRAAILKSKQWLRGEFRRRCREQTAAQLGTTMKTPDEKPALLSLVPLLDEALLSLGEKERTALLLRYFESRSLREVGVSLGVGEDAAQKRVAAALQHVSRFFQRRGFKTATAAATAVALQQTATTAPAALSGIVIHAALQSAPSAVTGLTALLSRLAGFTKTQTAGLCLVLAAAPITWQWNQTHAAQNAVSALEHNFESARVNQEEVAVQTERLHAESTRLQAALASAPPQSSERGQAAERALSQLRTRMRNLLTAADYQWPENFPFVRVPKSALREIGSGIPAFGPKGNLAQWIQEVLELTPDRKEAVEFDLANHLGYIDRLAAGRTSETNWSSPDGFFHKSVTVAALGAEAQGAEDQLATNFATMLGPEAAKLVMSPLFSQNQWISPERISHAMIGESQEFILAVKPNESGPPEVRFIWENHIGSPGPISEQFVPQFLMDRYQPWLWQLGITSGVFSHSEP
jgi:RNA polymerase sigma factor (sigma-70 family)